jgi:hypothetical protein
MCYLLFPFVYLIVFIVYSLVKAFFAYQHVGQSCCSTDVVLKE